MTRAIAFLTLLALTVPAGAETSDLMVAVLKNGDGQTSVHKQLVPTSTCRRLLNAAAHAYHEGVPFNLGLMQPPSYGRVTLLWCVAPDGKITSSPVLELGAPL